MGKKTEEENKTVSKEETENTSREIDWGSIASGAPEEVEEEEETTGEEPELESDQTSEEEPETETTEESEEEGDPASEEEQEEFEEPTESEEEPAQPETTEEEEPKQEQEEPPEEPQQPETSEEYQKRMEEQKEAAIGKLRERFKLTDEQKEKFDEDPATVLEELSANIYYDLFQAMYQTFNQQLPTMVQQTSQQLTQAEKLESDFYNKWPELKNPKYQKTIEKSLEAYKQVNPQATTEELIDTGGAWAMQALKLKREKPEGATKPKPKESRQPHKPVKPGATAADPRPPKSEKPDNLFAAIAEETLREEEIDD